MERKMTKTENILDNIALTNLFLIFLAIMSACISVNTIERLPIVVRHYFIILARSCCAVFTYEFRNYDNFFILACNAWEVFRYA